MIDTTSGMFFVFSFITIFYRSLSCGLTVWKKTACHLLARWFAQPLSSTLKMEVICSSETLVATQQITRRHILEDDTFHNHLFENLKCYKTACYFLLIMISSAIEDSLIMF
jgi:hypothetical protein